jgi:hypothetical protein
MIAAVGSAALASSMLAAEIPAGTHLLLSTENAISTRTARIGDAVHFRTVTPISAAGKIVIPVGTYAQGVVTQTRSSGRAHRPAQFQIQVVRLLLPSGQVLNISSQSSSIAPEGHDPRGRVAPNPLYGALVAGAGTAGALTGFAIGAQLGGSEDAGGKGALIGLGAAIVAVIVIPAVLHRGKEVELRQGTAVDVVFDQPATID